MNDEAAVDALIEREPNNIAALVEKGHLRQRARDDRAASAFYQAALRAAAAAKALPASLRPVIERARAGFAECQASFDRHTEEALAAAGFPSGHRPDRFQESIDLMRGVSHTQLQLQQPTAYYFPGLPQRRYYERADLPWAAQIEAAAPTIKAELLEYLAKGDDAFSPYLVTDPTRPRSEYHGLVDNPDWSTLYIFSKGSRVTEMEDRFARTLASVEQLDLPRITVRAPSILFSRLAPGAHIPPHHGVMNARLICHLPLIVPPRCGFRVGGEVREWHEGELLVFDDTVEHEAWNHGTSERIILIFDVWRPEVTTDERRAITSLFEVVDNYGAETPLERG
jgi:aspartyl/asparaginyl beta-hydroxylase (cupin superfamily)